jgi:pyruvate/2-oxoglutarate/acetoin dehydrogenase E1 component
VSEVRYWQAVNRALADGMEKDPRVVIFGEDVAAPGGAFGATKGLLERFGSQRVRDTPISELAIAGVGVGAALTGLRPVIEIMFNDFTTLALDQIVNQAAKLRFMTGGRGRVPLVIRTMVGSGKGTGPQHGQSLEAWFGHTPGLSVVMPSTVADAYGLLMAALAAEDPVVVMESMALWSVRGELEADPEPVPLGTGKVRREGDQVTLVGLGPVMAAAERAAELAADQGAAVELIDLRSLWPLDTEIIRRSLRRTGRLVIAHHSVGFLGPGAEVAAWAADQCFELLKGPIRRVAPPRSPVPFAPALEHDYFPTAERILAACLGALPAAHA